MDKGTNAKELRNFGISLIIHDRRPSGVYILIYFSPKAGRNKVYERKRRAKGRKMGGGEERKESNRLNLAIFLVCAFLVALSIYVGVLTKQTV